MTVALLMLAAGCTMSGGAGSPTRAPLDLSGTWLLQSGTGPAGEVRMPDEMRITINFTGNQAGGQACNHYGGEYQLAGNAIRIGMLSMTEMACQQDVMAAESAYHAALAAVTRVERDGGRLVLSGDGAELVYELQPPVPDAALRDTAWLLESIIQGDAVSSVQGEARLHLNADGSFDGSTGCRDFSGQYTINGDRVVATSLAAEGECPAELTMQDALVLEVLADGFTVRISEDRLTLMGSEGSGLEYIAAD